IHTHWRSLLSGCLLPRLPRANPHSEEGHLPQQRPSLGNVVDLCCSLSTFLLLASSTRRLHVSDGPEGYYE
ncbi:uncharacterized protein CLUP02_03820, partial [Colletotrichum lupini]